MWGGLDLKRVEVGFPRGRERVGAASGVGLRLVSDGEEVVQGSFQALLASGSGKNGGRVRLVFRGGGATVLPRGVRHELVEVGLEVLRGREHGEAGEEVGEGVLQVADVGVQHGGASGEGGRKPDAGEPVARLVAAQRDDGVGEQAVAGVELGALRVEVVPHGRWDEVLLAVEQGCERIQVVLERLCSVEEVGYTLVDAVSREETQVSAAKGGAKGVGRGGKHSFESVGHGREGGGFGIAGKVRGSMYIEEAALSSGLCGCLFGTVESGWTRTRGGGERVGEGGMERGVGQERGLVEVARDDVNYKEETF